ncbi:hypothetical protein L6164_021802 [Bauhinia variegata]|uniref:Uncharacterized protein n=1 Tax=Bauhinia variegata TaxID=167791 RepID=A0ACB9MCQ9_BAUVA|nr:hypothetical protein L6164_021802 [Bauhinia variegata]
MDMKKISCAVLVATASVSVALASASAPEASASAPAPGPTSAAMPVTGSLSLVGASVLSFLAFLLHNERSLAEKESLLNRRRETDREKLIYFSLFPWSSALFPLSSSDLYPMRF